MTLNDLKSQYALLRDEIDSIDGAGIHSEARVARLMGDLDRIDQELAAFKRRAKAAPTLRDVVTLVEPIPQRQNAWERRASVR